jgi:hypothetical protein
MSAEELNWAAVICMNGESTGRLVLPMPELGKGAKDRLNTAANDMQARIRAQTPEGLRDSIVVKAFKKGKSTGIAIEYDDRAENFVYIAMEYPRPGKKEETSVPRT